MKYIHSSPSGRIYSVIRLAVTALLSAFLISATVTAQEEIADNGYLSIKDGVVEGTVNSVHSDSSMLIVDDHSFILDRVIKFNNDSWSRDQAIQRIAEGDRVKLELGDVADARSGARIVRSITVIDQ